MELWIRSQDKSNLKIVNDIYVEEITKDYDTWVGNIHSRPYVVTSNNGNLGFYATNERALEVLNEIQNYLEKMGTDEILTDKVGIMNGIKHYGIVYEMPEK